MSLSPERSREADRLVDEGLAVGHRGLLVGIAAAEIAARPHARADGAARESGLVEFLADVRGVDV